MCKLLSYLKAYNIKILVDPLKDMISLGVRVGFFLTQVSRMGFNPYHLSTLKKS